MAFRGSLSRSLFATARSTLRPPAPHPRQRPASLSAPSTRRYGLPFVAPRSVAALGCSQSLLPLHSVVATVRLTSHLSANARACFELSQVNWWMDYGSGVPNLQKMAIRILSLTCSASSCERNWSTFEQVHTKKRNRLEQKKLNDLVFVQYNQRLRTRYLRFQQSDLDPISLEDIDACNEWISHPPGEQDFVDENEDLTWLDVEVASGLNEGDGTSTRSRSAAKKQCLGKGRGVATSSRLQLIDEDEDEVDADSEETSEDEIPIEDDDDSE